MNKFSTEDRSRLIRLAATMTKGDPMRRAILAGCEKLPNKAMQDNCEEKKEEGKKNDEKDEKKD